MHQSPEGGVRRGPRVPCSLPRGAKPSGPGRPAHLAARQPQRPRTDRLSGTPRGVPALLSQMRPERPDPVFAHYDMQKALQQMNVSRGTHSRSRSLYRSREPEPEPLKSPLAPASSRGYPIPIDFRDHGPHQKALLLRPDRERHGLRRALLDSDSEPGHAPGVRDQKSLSTRRRFSARSRASSRSRFMATSLSLFCTSSFSSARDSAAWRERSMSVCA